jgi:hypothetical protein
MRSSYAISDYVLFGDIDFSLGTIPVGRETIPVAIFRNDRDIAACRIICPESKTATKKWLVHRLQAALADELEACHTNACCRECLRSILSVHSHLSTWLSPELHGKLLETIANHT